MKPLLILLSSLVLTTPLLATIEGQAVHYQAGDTACDGYLAADTAVQTPQPGILVVHDWMGLTKHTEETCLELAKLGYVALAADIYGHGVRPADRAAAGTLAGKYKSDRALLRQRVNAGLAQLQATQGVIPTKIAAIGFCFGGTTVLELARSGAPVAGVVSFHGGLDSPTPADGQNIKAKVLILHGADDPTIKKEDLEAFENEMRGAHVDWQMVAYGNAVHAFTQPWVGTDPSKGVAYNEKAARRSWQAMQDFFGELFH